MRVFVLKPDGIGDFVLSTGAIRALAREYGEENLIICVREVLVPLAREQFPVAEIWPLPVALKRKVLNLFLRNLLACVPLWFRMRFNPVDFAVCLRGLRNYLETALFYSIPARRYISWENHLCRGRKVRGTVENILTRVFRSELVEYPETPCGVPLEIEAFRRVVSRTVGRDVAVSDVMPHLRARIVPTEKPVWICAPITEKSKVYPLDQWVASFSELQPELEGRTLLLVGSEDQKPQLAEFASALHSAGITQATVFIPASLVAFLEWIAAAEIVFTVDTAAAHFATALNQRCIVAFSGLHSGMFAPWQSGDRQAWLLAEPRPKKKSHWYKAIPPGRIASEARRVLALSK
ncbi:ADP-heptose:LPS heptosyltransferase [Terrimicrobium sacchariphilum]|uniref:ADP-heptose:LPS heptosyltransferase n=1 Tax=Terrimicrobium sacchariphilum TaxID=690879 RepID=A0A146G7M8_TERSA|nr:glycosyltransferase family 9 protein [Terrimicrobium sacchariphilum]GAT33362.1 ADP-heptose:LPS heptosyltransferase [Terrimicrobium sacchariphilum]